MTNTGKKTLLMEDAKVPFRPLQRGGSSAQVVTETGTIRMTGVFQNWKDVNLNERLYPKTIWDKQLGESSPFRATMASRKALGHIEHPEDGITRLDKAAIVVTEAWVASDQEIRESQGALREGDILGTLEILETHEGQVLKALTKANIPWGVSSRGSGTILEGENEGYSTVDDDYVLETWDAVFSPSVARAIPKLIESIDDPNKLTESVASLDREWAPSRTPLNEKARKPKAAPEAALDERDQAQFDLLRDILSEEHREDLDDLHAQFRKARAAGDSDGIVALRKALREMGARIRAPKQDSPPADNPVREASQQTKPTTTMSQPITEGVNNTSKIREARTRLITLTTTPIKGLKASERAALLESADNIRREVGALVSQDPACQPLAQDLYERANRFIARIDEDEDEDAPAGGPPPPPAGGPPAGSPPAGGPPPPAGEPDGDEIPSPEDAGEVVSQLTTAAELLRDVGSDEADAAADQLDALADRVGDVVDDAAPELEDAGVEDMPVESRRLVRSLVRRHNRLEEQLRRMTAAANRLLESQKGGSKVRHGLHEATAAEWAKSATELAEMYNKDMVELGLKYLEAKAPHLAQKIAESGRTFKTYKALTEATAAAKAGRPAAAGRPATTGRPAPRISRQPVGESTSPSAGAGRQASTPPVARLEESVHPAVALLERCRK